MIKLLAVLSVLFTQTSLPQSQSYPGERAGDVREIQLEILSRLSGDDGSSGSSTSRDRLIETVRAVSGMDITLDYDVSSDLSADDRAANWQFPARVLRRSDGSLELLNEPEVKARIAAWLEKGGLTPDQCGRWIFTWNAFKIECDPQSLLPVLADYDLRISDLREGAPISEAGGLGVAHLRKSIRSNGAEYVAEWQIDPDALRSERAQNDIVVAEISGQTTLSLADALEARAAERISGTINVRFETDATGRVMRKVKVTSVSIVGTSGSTERTTTTQTTEQRLISAGR